jgi:hypothetical protein
MYAEEGPGDEQSRRNGKGGVSNSRPGECMPRNESVMSRVAEMAREVSETHDLVNECRGRTGC